MENAERRASATCGVDKDPEGINGGWRASRDFKAEGNEAHGGWKLGAFVALTRRFHFSPAFTISPTRLQAVTSL